MLVKRLLFIWWVAGLLVAAWLPASAGGEVRFTSGIASGDVTATEVVLWTRVDRQALLFAHVAGDGEFQQTVAFLPAVARASTDYTVKVAVRGLHPAQRYFYRFEHFFVAAGTARRQASERGQFRTAPPLDQAADVRFAFSGDAEATLQPFTVLQAVLQEDPDFFIYLGDTIYADVDSAAGNITRVAPSETLAIYRAKYRENREDRFLRGLLAATSVYAIWDDHEVVDNFAGETVDRTLLSHGLQTFLAYMPVRVPPLEPGRLFRRFRWGRDVELFILDERQYRSAERFCYTKEGELALVPALQTPRCRRTALAAPGRTILDARQQRWLKRQLLASEATFKFIINSVPISQLFVLPYDRWEGYGAERRELLEFIRDAGIANVIFLTTDLHASLILEVSPSRRASPVGTEIIVGPIAHPTLLDDLMALGVGEEELDALALLLQPRCANLDAFSYAVVEVNSQARPQEVTVTLKDQAGTPLRDFSDLGKVCRLTIQATAPTR